MNLSNPIQLETKVCTRCKKDKPLSEFRVVKNTGWYSRCKTCCLITSRLWNKKPERIKYNAEYSKRPEVKQRKAELMAQYMKQPECIIKNKARRKLRSARENGTLVRQPCSKCGGKKVEGHHKDYSQPLLVIWLCRVCHRKEHAAATN